MWDHHTSSTLIMEESLSTSYYILYYTSGPATISPLLMDILAIHNPKDLLKEGTLNQEKIAAIKCEEGYEGELSFPWASWLPRIMLNMNTQWHATTKEMPYKLVFGQVPWSALVPGASKYVVNEEDMNSVISASPPKVAPTPSLKRGAPLFQFQ